MALDHGIGVRIPASQPIHTYPALPAGLTVSASLRPTRDPPGEDHGLPHLGRAFGADGTHVFMVKMNYWLGL